jgi:hypothetical protein
MNCSEPLFSEVLFCFVRYTYYPCRSCPSFNAVTQTNGCSAVGLQTVIPRTKAHWVSMFSFVRNPTGSGGLGTTLSSYFQVVPGVYKATDGKTPCGGGNAGIMNSDYCLDRVNGWRALDGGKWWLRSSLYSQPDGVYSSFSLLGLAAFASGATVDDTANNFVFDDGSANYFSGYNYICSTNDFNTGLPPPISSEPVPAAVVANEFAQSNNPTLNGFTTDYTPILLQQKGDQRTAFMSLAQSSSVFAGLRSACSGAALLEGASRGCGGWFAVGAYSRTSPLGLQGPSSAGLLSVGWVQLHALTGGNVLRCPAGTYAVGGASSCMSCGLGMCFALLNVCFLCKSPSIMY